ncbi:CDGP domain-containing protein [Mycobacterium sp.]|uniref:CDGP domain-containing protein n=1 Tax=Mycobacterium sp. TaxID=1785 RepID=UPI003BB094DB
MTLRLFVVAGLAAVVAAGGVVTAAPQASAGCVDPNWAPHPMAQMCDSLVDQDGMWERCLSYHNGGIYSPEQTDCYVMSAGDPPKEGDPILLTPPTHIDP